MFSPFITSLQEIAFAAGMPGLVFISFLQEVFPPIPSTLIATMSGFIFMEGVSLSFGSFLMLLVRVALPLSFGLTLGAGIIYGVVYWGGAPLVKRFGHLAGISWNDIEKLRSKMHGTNTDEVLLFLGRAFPLVPSVLLNVFCGLVRWNPVSFFVSTFFGTLVRTAWSAFVGWQVGEALLIYASAIEQATTVVFVISIIGTGAFLWWHKKRMRTTRVIPEEDLL